MIVDLYVEKVWVSENGVNLGYTYSSSLLPIEPSQFVGLDERQRTSKGATEPIRVRLPQGAEIADHGGSRSVMVGDKRFLEDRIYTYASQKMHGFEIVEHTEC